MIKKEHYPREFYYQLQNNHESTYEEIYKRDHLRILFFAARRIKTDKYRKAALLSLLGADIEEIRECLNISEKGVERAIKYFLFYIPTGKREYSIIDKTKVIV